MMSEFLCPVGAVLVCIAAIFSIMAWAGRQLELSEKQRKEKERAIKLDLHVRFHPGMRHKLRGYGLVEIEHISTVSNCVRFTSNGHSVELDYDLLIEMLEHEASNA